GLPSFLQAEKSKNRFMLSDCDKPDAKLGTYYSLVLPYPLIFSVVWLLMLLAWYLVGLPIGPGIYPRLS
ncbi:AbgT family transporter, partial [Escherichia coli]